jgi:hypothetical protein
MIHWTFLVTGAVVWIVFVVGIAAGLFLVCFCPSRKAKNISDPDLVDEDSTDHL